jgi:hypothetical protein
MLSTFKEYLNYNRETGVFTWVKTPRRGRSIDAAVGTTNKDGYLVIRVRDIRIMAHRLAWAFEHGVLPEFEIDHRNGQRADNRISNLRVLSHLMNQQNQRKPHVTNQCGFLGVDFHKASGKYRAQIRNDGARIYGGLFDTPEQAYAKYLEMKRALHESNTL